VKHEKEPMDEYKSRLSDYLTDMIREELEKYDGGYTDEWNDQRKKNAEVLGYKLSGKSDIKEGATEFWQDMFRPGNIPNKYINQLIKKKGELPSKSHIKSIYKDNGNPSSSQLSKAFKQLAKEKYIRKQGSMWKWESGFAWRTGTELESINEAYKVHAKSKLGIGPKKWELEKFLTGGKSFDFKKGMEIVKKLRRMSSSIDYKLIKESVNEAGMGILDKDQTDVLHAIVMRNKNKNSNSILKIALKDRMFKGIDKRELLGYIEGAKQFVRYMGRTGNESVNETQKRDYKAEYKKFQSSTKAKKYRAELNQYNRKKGTYGNNDGKDASHKGGKIVGFEKESTNRGRREKSRLKKEDIREDIGLDVYLGGIIKAMRKSRLKPKTAKVMKHGFSKSKDKIGFFIDVEKREIEGKKLWTLQLEVDRDGYLWYLSAPKDIKIGKWADTSQLVRGFKKLDRLPGFGQDAIFKRRR
jgi:hypothetical protein